MVLLCAAAPRPGCTQSRRIGDTPADASQFYGLLALLPPSSRAPRWLGMEAALDAPCRAALAAFVSSIVLQRSAAARDIARARSAGRPVHRTLIGPYDTIARARELESISVQPGHAVAVQSELPSHFHSL